MEKEFEIQDESGDKNYFTIIPNYIANHSTANDQALYFQMKKYAGEKGECFASEVLLRKKLGIGRNSLKKSIQYLIDHDWVKEKGFREVQTRGGIQKIKVYSINDIWKLNNDFYKGCAEITSPKDKGCAEITSRVGQNDIEGIARMTTNKNHSEEEPYNNNAETSSASSKKLNLKDETPMSLQEFMNYCKKSSQRHIQIIGEWAEVIELNYTSKGQWNSFIKRNVRPASDLIPFTEKQLQEAFKKIENDLVKIDNNGKKVGFITKFTLETLLKYI